MSDPTTQPSTDPAAPQTQQPAISWLPADADPTIVGHAQNAKWASPADAVKSHYELQKLFGADRHGRTVVIPKEDATPEERAAFYERLGRPKTPEEYGFKVPEGGDPKFAEKVAGKLHELGIPASQAQELFNWYTAEGQSLMQADDAAYKANLEAEHAALKQDWGTEEPMRRELARRAAERLGLDGDAIGAMEQAVGFSKTLKALAKMGDLMRESGTEGLGELGSFGMTPEGARAKRAQLMADPDFRAKAMNQNSSQWAEIKKLDAILAAAV